MSAARPAAYRCEVDLTVYVEVNDPSVIERVTGPEGDSWRESFYNLKTTDDVLRHLAYNAVNGVTDVSRLDGWADCASDAVVFTLDSFESRSEPWD